MFKVSLIGLNGLKADFVATSKKMIDVVDAEVNSAAADFVAGARRDAPIDQGVLKGSISYSREAPMVYPVVAQKFYAPFVEFGTKGKYKPIPGTEAIAAQFKGYKGGDFMELLRMIVRWVARKGITGRYSVKTKKRLGSKVDKYAEDYAAAWPIALSILKNGIRPHPYFFKQQEVVWPKMVERIKKQLEDISRVSVILPGDIKRPKIITV